MAAESFSGDSDGEAKTGALTTSWPSKKFVNPARDGAVLPILHLNGFKIANPTVLARISRHGNEPHFVEGDVPAVVHQRLTDTLDTVVAETHRIQSAGACSGAASIGMPVTRLTTFR